MRARIEDEPINLGFQMAPMIDVIFVIMLFYMVRAGTLKMEHQLRMTLPSAETKGKPSIMPVEEIIISIDEDGIVALNDEEISAPEDVKLDSLSSLLVRLRENATSHGAQVMATLQTDPTTPYQRVMDVMNALSRAKISNMTFTVGEEEQ